MEKLIKACQAIRGEVTPPGDKSISHRAVLLNSITEGRAKVTNFSPGADFFSTVGCLRALGVGIEEGGRLECWVYGVGRDGLREPQDVLDAGNSATTMRLLTGLLAPQPFFSIITGDESLRSRPMDRLIHPLRLMGAQIWGRGADSLPPLAIRGNRLRGIEYRLPVASAQLKSALLLAGLFAEGDTVIEEPTLARDHTERLLTTMGAKLEVEGGRIVVSPSPSPLRSVDVHVPGDISAAAFWLVAATIHPDARLKILNVGVNPMRTGIIDVLRRMGARLGMENTRMESGEPVADLWVASSHLVGTQISGELIPRLIDEIPVIALAASLAKGTTVIRDAGELRVKETDRIATTVKELSRLGAKIEELADGMVIHGVDGLRGAPCYSHRDHRLAMMLGVAALVARGQTVVYDAEAVEFSYPDFWQDVEELSVH